MEDIDLFIGMTLETPDNGSITGNTFRCLIGDQFARLKWGDRFFYDLQNQQGSFNNGKIWFCFSFKMRFYFYGHFAKSFFYQYKKREENLMKSLSVF